MMISLSVLRVVGREKVSRGFQALGGVIWVFLSRMAFGLFQGVLAEYVEQTFPFLNSRKKKSFFFFFFF